MKKYISKLIVALLFVVAFTGHAYAANLNIRVEQPKSPTNQDNFNVNFVALDVLDRTVTVKCYKKAPSDGSFSQFGSDISLSAGGNTGNCTLNSSILSQEGTYSFYVTATAGAETVTSQTVSVAFEKSRPDAPINFHQEKSGSCQYKITFRTANDNNQTVKVEIYRSENTSFTADGSTKVGSVAIGSNQDVTFLNDVPDCGKEYHYAVRAFDSAGNGSGVAADSIEKVHTITISPTIVYTSNNGALQTDNSQVGSEEEETKNQKDKNSSESSNLDGESSEELGKDVKGTGTQNVLPQNYIWYGIGLLVIVAGYIFYRSRKSE